MSRRKITIKVDEPIVQSKLPADSIHKQTPDSSLSYDQRWRLAAQGKPVVQPDSDAPVVIKHGHIVNGIEINDWELGLSNKYDSRAEIRATGMNERLFKD